MWGSYSSRWAVELNMKNKSSTLNDLLEEADLSFSNKVVLVHGVKSNLYVLYKMIESLSIIQIELATEKVSCYINDQFHNTINNCTTL